MSRRRVLAVCIHNSARSQMVEEYLRSYGGDLFDVESAGIEPGELNPIVVELLREDGIDIGGKSTRSVFDLHRDGRQFDYVIAVCDAEAAERCPVFPAEVARYHWPFPDPSAATGSSSERVAEVRVIREAIKRRVVAFVEEHRARIEKEASQAGSPGEALNGEAKG